MYLTVTIDTEEDNWGVLNADTYTVENLGRIPGVQELFMRHEVRPTYLISYPVATSRSGIEVLGKYRNEGLCEIGTHPHAWNTPPLREERTQFNSYICNLPVALQHEKIRTLTDTIEANFGARPTSHRSGRWGFSEEVAQNLIDLHYAVDTSIFPVWNWGPDGPDFTRFSHEPYEYRRGRNPGSSDALLEVPATVGLLEGSGPLARSTFHGLKRLPLGNKVVAILRRAGVLTHVCLSPEIDDAPTMIRLATRVLERGGRVVNMFFHSPTLLEGRTPFARSASEVDVFLGRIDAFLTFVRSIGLRSVTMSELTANELGVSRVRTLTIPKRALA